MGTPSKFKFSDVKHFPYLFWVLITGFVLFDGMDTSGLNIGISRMHHMFGISYETVTFIRTFGSVVSILSYVFGGVVVRRYGHITELLIVSTLGSVVANFVHGWVNDHIAWIFVAQLLGAPAKMSYPVVWTAIPLLVGPKVQGTAFGIATASRFAIVAVCLVVVGLLTREEDGDTKYVLVQVFLMGLGLAATMIYVLVRFLDIKYNDALLRSANQKPTGRTKSIAQDADISMQKVTI